MVGFELSRFIKNNVSILPEHICKICQLVLNSPVQCSKCKIWICSSCIENACTHCECSHSFTETNKFMKSKIDELTVRCIFYNNGCPFACKVSQLGNHEKSCEFRLMICQSKNCIKESNSSGIKHAKDCGFYPINCEICKKAMRSMERKDHKCIDYLLDMIENIERKNKDLAEENIELRDSNEKRRENANKTISAKENDLKTLKETNGKLQNKNLRLTEDLENEKVRVEVYYNNEMDKFYHKCEDRIRNFGKKSVNESNILSNKLNKHMQELLIKVNGSLSDFNSKVAVDTNDKFNINVDTTICMLNESCRKGK